jgi:hypothetical protein
MQLNDLDCGVVAVEFAAIPKKNLLVLKDITGIIFSIFPIKMLNWYMIMLHNHTCSSDGVIYIVLK